MRRLGIPLGLIWLMLAASAATAQDNSTFTASLLGGFSGTLDGGNEGGFGHSAWQASFGMVTSDRTLSVLRVGRLGLGEASIPGLVDPSLEYVLAAGEYRFRSPAYDAGIFAGLGGYRLEGQPPVGARSRETALGVALGFTGDFDVTRHLSLVGELDFHYAFLDQTQFYGAALAGVAIHF